MRQKLESKGWIMYYECKRRCGYKQYFSSTVFPQYKIVTRPSTYTFTILMEGLVIAGPLPEYQLETALAKYIK